MHISRCIFIHVLLRPFLSFLALPTSTFHLLLERPVLLPCYVFNLEESTSLRFSFLLYLKTLQGMAYSMLNHKRTLVNLVFFSCPLQQLLLLSQLSFSALFLLPPLNLTRGGNWELEHLPRGWVSGCSTEHPAACEQSSPEALTESFMLVLLPINV